MKTIPSKPPELSTQEAIKMLRDLETKMIALEESKAPILLNLNPNYHLSGANLLHYMVMRNAEIRQLQDFLVHSGLSSLAHNEGYTLAQIQLLLKWLTNEEVLHRPAACTYSKSIELRKSHIDRLLGPMLAPEKPHIMVTLSAENSLNGDLMASLLQEGMSVARINCAHDNPSIWLEMIQLVHTASEKTKISCKIYMDLGGPKIRVEKFYPYKSKSVSALKLSHGQQLLLCSNKTTARNIQKELHALDAIILQPEELLGMIKVGENIFFDDGKFSGKIILCGDGFAVIEMQRIPNKKPYLKVEKGVNLPDSELVIDALTQADREHIPFVCKYADLVGFSFVESEENMEALRNALADTESEHKPAVILKIERLAAVNKLPQLLLNGMKDASFGVMIARGDLAVEIGFERLSEIQQEILWICEAAHTPVIWATQVLENLNKEGIATRSEITDAAMSVRAECVMLNKGKFILETVKTLNNILTRQLGHISKKRYIMRPLMIAEKFMN